MSHTFIQLSPEELENTIERAVQRALAFRQPPQEPTSKYVPIEVAAQQYNLRKSYLYRLSSNRTISTRRVGKTIQFHAQELENYFDQQVKKSKRCIDENLEGNLFPTLKVGKEHKRA